MTKYSRMNSSRRQTSELLKRGADASSYSKDTYGSSLTSSSRLCSCDTPFYVVGDGVFGYRFVFTNEIRRSTQ